jgi:hypothetical protein
LKDAMTAVTIHNPLVLCRVPGPDPGRTTDRPVTRVVASGDISRVDADPLLDQISAYEMAPRRYS